MLANQVYQVAMVCYLVDLRCCIWHAILFQVADQPVNEVKQETVVRTVFLADQAQLDFPDEMVNQASMVHQVCMVESTFPTTHG